MSWQNTKLCLSLFIRDEDDVNKNLEACSQADIVELRLDRFPEADFVALKELIQKPLIVTIRIQEEGGHWSGSQLDRYPFFQKAIDSDVDYIDIEWGTAAEIVPLLKFKTDTQLILSLHTAENDLNTLMDMYAAMLKEPAHLYKLIFQSETLNDNLKVLKVIDLARKSGRPFVIHGMGENGEISRLLGGMRGNALTYVSPASDRKTAPGQISLHTARNQYYLKEKTTESSLIGLLGFPVEQSKGWLLHNRLMHIKNHDAGLKNKIRKDFLYVNFPAPELESFWINWKSQIGAASVTIPHKENIVAYLSEKSESVDRSGVCNTVIRDGVHWTGYNTDESAIFDILEPLRERFKHGILIFGTGATARSAITAVQRLNVDPIFVSGRNTVRGEALKYAFNVQFMPLEDLERLKISGIIQTTPIGMFPKIGEIPPITGLLPSADIVFDVIYNPVITKFLRLAKGAGCHSISGEEMFIRQASKQFEIFSGLPVSLEEVRHCWQEISGIE